MGSIDKLLLPLDGEPLLIRTLRPFLDYSPIGRIVVSVNPERIEEFTRLFETHFGKKSHLSVTAGGEHRQQSILHALRVLSGLDIGPGEPVLVHDGARPFVTEKLFDDLLDRLGTFDGVIPAAPVRDTVKRVDGLKVLHTEDRETLRLVQTPQAFEFQALWALHERAAREKYIGTDDASLLERYGLTVGWVDGPAHNLKVTVPEDLEMVNYLFRHIAKGTR